MLSNIPTSCIYHISYSETGSATPSVQKWIIDENVEDQLRSGVLRRRLRDGSL